MRRLAFILAATALLVVACSATPTVLPSRDFNRPTDMALLCMGVVDGANLTQTPDVKAPNLRVTGRPMSVCHPIGQVDPANDIAHLSFAFVPNSSSGEMTVIDADHWKLVDLDPGVPGYNQATLGVLPEQIVASDDGCRLVTANRGSCDLTLVDPAVLLAPTLAHAAPGIVAPDPKGVQSGFAETVAFRTAAGQLKVAPQEIQLLPTHDLTNAGLCPLAGEGASWSAKALVTFPSCDLVALVDLPSGNVLDSVYVRSGASGIELVPGGANPTCGVVDCGDGAAAPTPDGGTASDDAGAGAADASDDGATGADADQDGGTGPADAGVPVPSTPGFVLAGKVRPGPLALVPDGTRAYVGLGNAEYIAALEITADGLFGAGSAIRLNDGAVGATRIRLSVNPWASETTPPRKLGRFAGLAEVPNVSSATPADRRYLYVIARDGSLRVVHVAPGAPEEECETNAEPQLPLPDPRAASACLPVGTTPRRPSASGPGMRFGSVPIDVAAVEALASPVAPNGAPTGTVHEGTVSGVYAWVLTAASGIVYLVNIDPIQRAYSVIAPNATDPNLFESVLQAEDPPFVNSIRDRNVLTYSRALDATSGPPRLDLSPTSPATGPRIEGIWTRGTADNAAALTGDWNETFAYFPDPRAVTPQTWSVVWEGPLMSGPRFSGKLGTDSGETTLEDRVDFCGVGVQEHDLVTLTGCATDGDCRFGQVCLKGNGGSDAAGGLTVNGLCIEPKDRERMTDVCGRLLTTVRRYEVREARPNVLHLVPHKDELVRPGIDNCEMPITSTSTAADGGVAGDGGVANPCVDPNDPSTKAFQCVDKRCLQSCGDANSAACRAGRICTKFADGRSFCADAPEVGQGTEAQCAPELTTYQLNVGRGYLVIGSAIGVPVTQSANDKGLCDRSPAARPNIVARISMDAKACDMSEITTVDRLDIDSRCNPNRDATCSTRAATELKILKATPTPDNPCLFIGGPNVTDGVDPMNRPLHVRALFRNTEMAFMMTNLETAPPGRLQLQFEVHGGFRPELVANPPTVEVSLPARILVGPFDANAGTTDTNEVPYVFVVDQRRLGRSQGGGPTRGQLLRIHPLGYLSPNTGGVQPIYQDLQRSGQLFPIQ